MKMSKALRFTLIFALVGLMTTLLIIYTQRSVLSTYHRSLPFITLDGHIKDQCGRAHLALERLLAGKSDADFNKDVLGVFIAAQATLQGVYDGNITALGKFDEVSDEETRVLLKKAIIDIEKLTLAAKERWELKDQAAPVPPPAAISDSTAADTTQVATNTAVTANVSQAAIDPNQQLDASFLQFQETMEGLGDHVDKNLNTDTAYLNTLSWASDAVVLASFAFLCTLLYRLQSSSDRAVRDNQAKLEEETRRVDTLSNFIEAVSAGNYNIEMENTGAEDSLTNTLVNMRNKLRTNADDDRKRNWSTTGLAQIGEILRRTTSSSNELFDSIIQFMVKYTKSNQGGLFVINEDDEKDPYLDLVGCYAFERKKFLTKRIQIGSGLVGQCYLEGERIYMLEVPHEYVSITSGLGGSNPSALLIVPLKVNGKIYGVVELASFNPFKDYEIDLVEKLAESVASTISNVRVNETTRMLLERTQQQAEEMKSQEEEIRQNMEELEATQEEMKRKQAVLEKELEQSQQQAAALRRQEKKLTESQDTLQVIVDNIPRAIFWKDKDLRFMGCNRIFASIAGVSSHKELIGKNDFDMAWSARAEMYRKDDQEVMDQRLAKVDIEEKMVDSNGHDAWLLTSKVPIVDQNNDVVAILGMFEDITARKQKDADIARKLEERDAAIKELTALKQLMETRKV
jgi:PAS domain S-box-containing protein